MHAAERGRRDFGLEDGASNIFASLSPSLTDGQGSPPLSSVGCGKTSPRPYLGVGDYVRTKKKRGLEEEEGRKGPLPPPFESRLMLAEKEEERGGGKRYGVRAGRSPSPKFINLSPCRRAIRTVYSARWQ